LSFNIQVEKPTSAQCHLIVVCCVQILVHGTVLCRRGVLMLTADNVTIYGGEVDSLLEVTPQHLLSSKLYVRPIIIAVFYGAFNRNVFH